jgi:hypothetical protein
MAPPEPPAAGHGSGADDLGHLVEQLRSQADACHELGSPLYGHLLERVADDVLAGGPAADVLAGHEGDPGPSALSLRLMGGVHRLVLERRAPELALYFPSVGGTADAHRAWPVLRRLLADQREVLRQGLDQPPQTNEVGRAGALVGGLLHVLARWPGPVRLLEIGASAGLNLRADQFRVQLAHGGVGPADSPVVLSDAWAGRLPPRHGVLDVVERVGCDMAPVDPTTTEGRLLLTSYVWPDQTDRLERLRGAFAVAARVPATVERRSALDFVRRLELAEGTTTVLWHSVMWQYLSQEQQAATSARLDELGAAATSRSRFAHLAFEPRRRTPSSEHEVLVVLRLWPDGEERILGSAGAHGFPTRWE